MPFSQPGMQQSDLPATRSISVPVVQSATVMRLPLSQPEMRQSSGKTLGNGMQQRSDGEDTPIMRTPLHPLGTGSSSSGMVMRQTHPETGISTSITLHKSQNQEHRFNPTGENIAKPLAAKKVIIQRSESSDEHATPPQITKTVIQRQHDVMATSSSDTDEDALVEKILRRLGRQLRIENERRGRHRGI
jgi:hypothetical protein